MTFNLATFESLVAMFVPSIIAAVVPGGATLGPLVAAAIASVETLLGAGTGPAKKAAVLTTVADAVTVLNTAKGTTVLDPTVTAAQVGAGIDLAIGVINDIQAVQGKTAAPVA
jgi:hypothetical protein